MNLYMSEDSVSEISVSEIVYPNLKFLIRKTLSEIYVYIRKDLT